MTAPRRDLDVVADAVEQVMATSDRDQALDAAYVILRALDDHRAEAGDQ